MLGAAPANALDFTFSFQNVDGFPPGGFVEGTLSGLVEGNNAGPGITATVTSTTAGGDLLGTYNFSASFNGNAFTVTGGNISFADVIFINGNNQLYLGTTSNNGFSNKLVDLNDFNPEYKDTSNSTTQFAPATATAVPFELNSTVGLATLGICFGAAKLRRKHLAKKRMVSV